MHCASCQQEQQRVVLQHVIYGIKSDSYAMFANDRVTPGDIKSERPIALITSPDQPVACREADMVYLARILQWLKQAFV